MLTTSSQPPGSVGCVRLVWPVLAVVLLAGCRDAKGDAISRGAADGAWRAVVEDWYVDRRFDRAHSCGAVREAMARLPADGGAGVRLREVFKTYEARVCTAQRLRERATPVVRDSP
jgi:hypothetical protein